MSGNLGPYVQMKTEAGIVVLFHFTIKVCEEKAYIEENRSLHEDKELAHFNIPEVPSTHGTLHKDNHRAVAARRGAFEKVRGTSTPTVSPFILV